MPYTSPYDLIQKASRRITSADRWATIKANTQERTSVPDSAPAPPAPQPGPYAPPGQQPPAQPARANARETEAAPVLMQPPFAPPQMRHPHLDEIAQRHTQALKNASARQEWKMPKAQDRPMPQPPAPPMQPKQTE